MELRDNWEIDPVRSELKDALELRETTSIGLSFYLKWQLAQAQGLFEHPFILHAAGASRASLALSLSLSKDLQATRVVSNLSLSLSLRYLELTKSAPPTLTAAQVIYWLSKAWIRLNWILTFNACAGKFELDLKMQKVWSTIVNIRFDPNTHLTENYGRALKSD